MARNLSKAGYPLVVFDVNKVTAETFKSEQNIVAQSPKEVASRSTHIITMLPSSPHVISVFTSGSKGNFWREKKNKQFA